MSVNSRSHVVILSLAIALWVVGAVVVVTPRADALRAHFRMKGPVS